MAEVKPKHLREKIYKGLGSGLTPLADKLTALGLSPNHITWTGVVLSSIAAWLVAGGAFLAGGIVWFIGGGLDTLDGTMARRQGVTSTYGSFLDSTTDRISDGVMFAALIYYFAANNDPLNAAITAIALLSAVLTSYARAKAESLGVKCKGGLVTRGERVFVIGIGLLFGQVIPALYVLFVLSLITVWQRISEAKEQLHRPA